VARGASFPLPRWEAITRCKQGLITAEAYTLKGVVNRLRRKVTRAEKRMQQTRVINLLDNDKF
jgi:hypothetical protein